MWAGAAAAGPGAIPSPAAAAASVTTKDTALRRMDSTMSPSLRDGVADHGGDGRVAGSMVGPGAGDGQMRVSTRRLYRRPAGAGRGVAGQLVSPAGVRSSRR
ncbi:hypothetical protein GCM10010278_20690 [Streptomyces melanogenes]|nr:hypothetical protein GCM10010278_20690 [Streptomyces melanogenes]